LDLTFASRVHAEVGSECQIRSTGACPGKVATGFPKRICADATIWSASRFN
jgi:hypothetical protein